jgi:hypothetical protein
MLVAASKWGPNLITGDHDAGVADTAAGTADSRIVGSRQRRKPLLPVVQLGPAECRGRLPLRQRQRGCVSGPRIPATVRGPP